MTPSGQAPCAGEAASRPRPPLSGYVLAFVVLIGSLLLVGLYARNAEQRERQAAQLAFDVEAQQITSRLRERLVNYDLILRGGASLFASVSRPSAEQWQDYVDGLGLDVQFPGLVGLGYAAYLSPGGLQALQLEMRDTGQGLFIVRPQGVREFYGPILYLEPKSPENIAAVGYDMYSEPVRRAAMLAARDSGEAVLTAPVRLLQDGARKQPGMLMYLPVYRARAPHATVRQRRDAIQGWVYVPIRVPRFVEAALRTMPRQSSFRIVDPGADAASRIVYTDASFSPAAASGDSSMFATSTRLDAYGRLWQLEFQAPSQQMLAGRMQALRTTLLTGSLASFLLFGIMCVFALTESRAQSLAARMTESYRRSELRLRNAMEYAAIGNALLDRDGVIIDANPALADMLGVTREQLAGTMLVARFVEGGDLRPPVQRLQTPDTGVYRTTQQLRRDDGEIRHLQLIFSPMPAEGEGMDEVTRLVQVEDITERVRAEATVQALNRTLEARVSMRTRELTQANQELESFAYSVSHDLRAPLRAIDGFSQLFADRYGSSIDDAGRDYLARVRKAAARMDELIDALLKMSRLTRGDLKIVPLDLGAIANDVVLGLRATQPQRRVQVEIARDLHASGDAALIRDLLENLLDNAWKFTEGVDEPRIEFAGAASADAGFAAFYIRDNGAGFAAEYASKLFRPFHRLHAQEQFSGHGIGLASVKRVIERHGGSIRAQGEPGKGATFYFTLPREGEAAMGKDETGWDAPRLDCGAS